MPTVLSIREADTKREGSRSAWATWQYPILKKKKKKFRKMGGKGRRGEKGNTNTFSAVVANLWHISHHSPFVITESFTSFTITVIGE